MQTSTITVSAVAPPAPGKKRGKITDQNGGVYQAGYPLLSSFQPGGTYSIQWKADNFNGYAFNVIEAAVPVGGSVGGAPQMLLPQTQAPMPPNTNYAPPTTQQPYVQSRPMQAPSDPLPERIFVCGALNSTLQAMGAGAPNCTEDQLVMLVKTYRRVFARTFGGLPSVGDEMNDEIPFERAPNNGGFQ